MEISIENTTENTISLNLFPNSEYKLYPDLYRPNDSNRDPYTGPFVKQSYATRLARTNSFIHFELDSLVKHSGNYSVSIAIDPSHPKDNVAYNWTRTYDSFIEGNDYTISGWMKTEKLKSPGFIVIQCWDTNQIMIGFASTQRDYPIKGTSDWTYAEKNFSVPEGTSELRIRIGIASPANNGGKAWFDDIKIE